MVKRYFIPSETHKYLTANARQELGFKKNINIQSWKDGLSKEFKKLIGYMKPEKANLNIVYEETKEFEDYIRKRIVYSSESHADVPAYLLIPKKVSFPAPTMICLQGHSTGFHISIGRAIYKGDDKTIQGDRDFAIQAVKNGFVALAIEQRCFGERKETLQKQRSPHGCFDACMHALMLGRTMIAERILDIQKAIDFLVTLPYVDKNKLCCMGNSGGGYMTFYAACVDERISLAIPSCSFCTYKHGIMSIYHCSDNYIPGILNVAEMYDLAGLIAPRKLIIVAGEKDDIFPIEGVKEAYKKAKDIYAAFKVKKNISLVVGKGGHRFYSKETWPVIKSMLRN